MCEICKAYKDFEHSIKIHNANKQKEHLYQSEFPVVNEYERKFKNYFANLAGKIMDDLVKEAFKIIKEKSKIKKALVMDINEIDRLRQIIDKNVLSFISQNFGVEQLTDSEKEFLLKHNINPYELSKEQLSIIDIAFKHGMYLQDAGRDNAKKINLHTFEQKLKSNKFLPLSEKEKAALNSVKLESAKHIKGLGNRWNDQTQSILIEADKKKRKELERVITDKTKEAIVNRSTVQEFASDLGHATGQWSRDLIRNSQYILHDAHEQGSAHEAERLNGGDAKVYKRVYTGACKHCERLFLTNGIGSKPIVFTLSKLRDNGSNIGKKVDQWQATISPVHPYCRCELVVLEDWEIWDEEKGKFVTKKKSKDELEQKKQEIRRKILEKRKKERLNV